MAETNKLMIKRDRRIFLAIPVGNSVYELLKAHLAQTITLPDTNWVAPENAHITIRFFGNVSNTTLSLMRQVLKEKLTKVLIASFSSKITYIDFFPPGKKRLLVAKIALNDQLQTLFELANDVADICDVKIKKTPYLPHITLYRSSKLSELQFSRLKVDAEVVAKDLILYESLLAQDARVYKPLEHYSLSPKRD